MFGIFCFYFIPQNNFAFLFQWICTKECGLVVLKTERYQICILQNAYLTHEVSVWRFYLYDIYMFLHSFAVIHCISISLHGHFIARPFHFYHLDHFKFNIQLSMSYVTFQGNSEENMVKSDRWSLNTGFI